MALLQANYDGMQNLNDKDETMRHHILALAIATASGNVFADPTLTLSTSTTSRDWPLTETPVIIPLTKQNYQLTISGIDGDCKHTVASKFRFSQPLNIRCSGPTDLEMKIRFSGDYAFHYDPQAQTVKVLRQPKASKKSTFKRPLPDLQCLNNQQETLVFNLGDTYSEGDKIREIFSGQVYEVKNQRVTVTSPTNTGGLVAFEALAPHSQPFTYQNANIYFVMVDRFNNGDRSNDHSYGRQKDGKQEVGTFHGGDLKGITQKLDYIKSLGTDVIWLSPIVEQVHGFVGGGESGSFPFYGYHGYWTRDFTKIDENFGNDEDLRELVTQAHQRGIKVFLDAVINHAGYATLADLQFDDIPVVQPNTSKQWQPKEGQNWHSYHEGIDYQSKQWPLWWGPDWVRAGLPGYQPPGSSDTTLNLAGLPDFITESDKAVTPPAWLLNNPGTRVKHKENASVADYLVQWQTDWVKRFGIDGFRVDTVKHVEGDVWLDLKQKAEKALAHWRAEQGKQGEDFWMMGEVWGHSAYRSPYADQGFDALINFDLQKKMDKGAVCLTTMDETYQHYANAVVEDANYTPVSYMSSHDTELFFARYQSLALQKQAANALMLTPGAIQVYYGDEVARGLGPYADDFHQGTRSDMIWKLDTEREALLKHWQILGQFRQNHPAIGAGEHKVIAQENAYVFSRQLGDDKVVIGFVGPSH